MCDSGGAGGGSRVGKVMARRRGPRGGRRADGPGAGMGWGLRTEVSAGSVGDRPSREPSPSDPAAGRRQAPCGSARPGVRAGPGP